MAEVDDVTAITSAPSAPSTSGANAPSRSAVGASKKRRIRFSNAWDLLLLKAVTAVDAHLSPHGEAQSRFEEALSLFKASVPAGCFEIVHSPTWKTLNDRFKKILSGHREAVKNNSVASGIIEVRGERDTLLDDIILAVDEWEEIKRTERDERTEVDRRLLQAGQEIRERALSRSRPGASTSGTGSDEANNGSSAVKHNSKKRSFSPDSDDDQCVIMTEHIKTRQLCEEKRLKIEQRRLEFEMKRDEREQARLEELQRNDSRRIAIDEKKVDLEERRLELDKEERKGAIAERKEVLAVLGALVKKLQ